MAKDRNSVNTFSTFCSTLTNTEVQVRGKNGADSNVKKQKNYGKIYRDPYYECVGGKTVYYNEEYTWEEDRPPPPLETKNLYLLN